MSTPRLNAELWVDAYIRRCHAQNCPAYLRRRGDSYAGAVLIKLDHLDGTTQILSRAYRGDGTPIWLRATGPVPVADSDGEAYLVRAIDRDPDLWVLEVESRQGWHGLDEPVE